jgi:hypothetical protein
MSIVLLCGFALGMLACWALPFITRLIRSLAQCGAFAGNESGKDLAVNISKLTKEVRRLSRNVRRILIEVEGIKKNSLRVAPKNPTKHRTKKRTSQVCDHKVRPVAPKPQKAPEVNKNGETKTALVAQVTVSEECAPVIKNRRPKFKPAAKTTEIFQKKLRSFEPSETFDTGRLPRVGEIFCLETTEILGGKECKILHPAIVEYIGSKVHLRHAITGELKLMPPEYAKRGRILLKPDPEVLQSFLVAFFLIPEEKPKIRFKDWVAKLFPEPGGKKKIEDVQRGD